MDREALQQRLEELNARAVELRQLASAEKRDFTQDEANELDSVLSEFDKVTEDLARLDKLERQSQSLRQGTGRQTAPDQPGRRPAPPAAEEDEDETPRPGAGRRGLSGRQTGPADTRVYAEPIRERKGGFRSLGDMAVAVRWACSPGGQVDDRLARLAVPSTWANEGSGSEGGFSVPADFRAAVMSKVMGEASLLARTDQIQTAGNTLTIPKDNGTPWGTSGIRAYWGSEAGLKTQSRPALDTMTLRLNKVYALIPITDELAEDAPAMDSFLRRKAPEAIDFAINLAIIQGTGSNQPLGVLNSPALVTVAKQGSQLADTVVAQNIVDMWGRLYAANRSTAIWSINQDVEPMLYTLSMPGRDNTGAVVTGWGTHVFMPAGGLSGSPYATLFGRPVIPTQACETLGDLGDIVLWDPQAYLSVLKSGPNPKVDVSMHLWFDYDMTAYRFVLRMTGQPWWDAPVTPRDGSNTLSPYVALAERA